ncbi:MAG: flagellar type III secretion system protein FlhB [Gammaproteobacteria bacterium]|nr:flagellar type III secretion system protein FlhB [Gammaproteobacteria bacterium]MBU1625520.1 flagellar type III secretion system protein FlhB [Gammaproteobacteria bacterium]MBU1980780.1 flagellar type III secretion system protein FlhB [Gammaproteobacteria bacterium]
MADQDSDLEKTESPSQRKLDKAREDGQVARSRELSTFMGLVASGAGLWMMGEMLGQGMLRLFHNGLTLDRALAFNIELMLPRLRDLFMDITLVFVPFLGLLVLVALFSPMLMSGWLFSTKALQPKFSKLNPFSGIKRMFSANSAIELLKALGKASLVGGIGAWVVWSNRDEVLQLVSEPVVSSIPHLNNMIWWSYAAIVAGMLLIVIIDVPFQLYEHTKKLKMTKEEVRRESKETEGDPQVKGRIRSMQREIARRRMMSEIPTADVVVTNPTHYSVALKYSEDKMRAPIVVAKGSHLLAAKIKEIAKEHNVPILEAPPLARALHKHSELGAPIPEALYTAVAEVLAYVYQLRRYKKQGGAKPVVPGELPVPKALDPLTTQQAEAGAD